MKHCRKYSWIGAVLMTAMLLVPAMPAWSDDARADRVVLHISALSDGKKDKTVSFSAPGTDKSLAINIPNGARIVSASMNVSGLPYSDGGADHPENVSVDLGNDGTPEWVFKGKAYGQMGNQMMFSNGNTSIKVTLPKTGGTNASATVRLPKNATVTSAKMDVKGSASKILCIYADNDPNYAADPPTKLGAFSNELGPIDIFNANQGTPTLEQLMGYSACLVWNAGYSGMTGYATWQNSVALGNVLADYVDAGGGVVCCHWLYYSSSKLGGRWDSSGYNLLPTNSGSISSTTTSIGTKVIPEHPILQNVSSISFNTLGIGFHGITAAVNGGQVVFTWATGSNVGAAVKTMANGVNRVDLQMNAWSVAAPGDRYRTFGCGYTGDGDILLKNCLMWAGGAGGSLNFSIDYANDGTIEWTNPNLNKTETVPDFSAQLNSYLARAPPNGTDDYGNQYVDVPIGVASNASSLMNISNLSVIYKLTALVGVNPVTGDLTGALNALVPPTYDMRSSNITIAIFSNHTGKVKISDISIDYTLVHPAIIQTRTPEESPVLMNENSTQEFAITGWDPYDFPMCVTWSVNKKVYLQNEWNMSWFADYDANGTYSVSVSVDNGELKVNTNWLLIVKNVNRKPMIDSFDPEKKFTMDENSSATFTVTASDPDKDPLTYAWYADGKRVSGEENVFEYGTTYASAGKHEVKVSVMDLAGAATVQTWEVTVSEVNAVPEITDFSPAGDEVSMNENSTKKFTVMDLSIDGDKHVMSWILDGNSTGVTGRSYEYAAGYDSAGMHEVAVEVSDGKLSARRTWNVNVADVNRPPVAAIAAPAPGAEFMVGEEIMLDGTKSSDPDGDPLSMTWTEGLKTLGTGQTLTVKLSKGKHTIALKVDDGGKNGQATTQVQLIVRYLDFGGRLTVDTETPVEGKQVKLSVILTNKGDGGVDELPVSFSVDGTEVSKTTIETIEPDAVFPLEFQWNAVKGDHKLDISVNDQTFPKTVIVAKKPVAAAPAGGDMMLMFSAAILVVVALVAGAAVYVMGKKRATGGPGAGETEHPQRSKAADAHKPIKKTAAVPAPRPRPVAAGAAAPDARQAPAISEDAKAKEAIENTQMIIDEAESAGIDTAKARQSLNVARNLQKTGKYQKAMQYCETAEDNIG